MTSTLPPDVAARVRAEARRRRVRRVVRPLFRAAGTIAAYGWLLWNAIPAGVRLGIAGLALVTIGALTYTPGVVDAFSVIGVGLVFLGVCVVAADRGEE